MLNSEATRYNKPMGNQFLGLSLFIMLLAFFIVLNTFSTFEEERSRPILQSLAVTFSSEDTPQELDPSVEEDPALSSNEGSVLDRIKSLFKAQISGVEIKSNRLGTVMYMRISQSEFEKAIVSPLKDPALAMQETFATFLVSLMDTETDIPYHMDIVLNIGDEPGEVGQEDPDALKSAMRTSAMYAKTINDAGLAAYQISAGLSTGDAGMIDLHFRPYVPFNPLGPARSESIGGAN